MSLKIIKEKYLVTISLILCMGAYVAMANLQLSTSTVGIYIVLVGVAMLFYIGPWTPVFSIEVKNTGKN